MQTEDIVYLVEKVFCFFSSFCVSFFRERDRNINLLFYLCVHSLVDSYACMWYPDRESNPQPWPIRMML